MKVMIIYAHPCDESFNKEILHAAEHGLQNGNHEVEVLDLYKEGFNPVMTEADLKATYEGKVVDPKVAEYQTRIQAAQHIVFIFPIWFESVPAILKGFLDRVFTNGWAFKSAVGKNKQEGLLTHLNATVISTMGASEFVYTMFLNNAVAGVLIKGVLKYSGVKKVEWFKFDNIQDVDNEKRVEWLAEVNDYMKKLD